VVTGTHLSRAI
jgi:hypothetical protein